MLAVQLNALLLNLFSSLFSYLFSSLFPLPFFFFFPCFFFFTALAVQLDALLPPLGTNQKSYKWAGRRAVGVTGRSLVYIYAP